jgi:ribosomal protein S18 acetylase RimI-like enzyme
MSIYFRTARKEDIPVVAKLIDSASGDFIDFLYRDLVPGKTTVQIIEQKFDSDDLSMRLEDCLLAETEGGIAGLSLSYPACNPRISPEMESLIPDERLKRIHENYSARVKGSWYLDSLAVSPKYKKRGIGSSLLDQTKKRGLNKGHDILSLTVFKDNKPAYRLYRKHGFVVERKVYEEVTEQSSHEGECVLMKCELKRKLPL